MPVRFVDELSEQALNGKRVFIRADFNVPLDGTRITDDARIQAALPTIKYVLERGGRPVLASHLGRPKGKPEPSMSLAPVAERLQEALDCDIIFPDNCIGGAVEKLAAELEEGQVLLLENLRFNPLEKKNDPSFAQSLAALCDVYINDAFGTSHRAHASVDGLPRLMRGRRAAGFLIKKEVAFLGDALQKPARPFVAVLGGAKVSDKIGVISALIEKADTIIIGGAMAYTFLKANGQGVGNSLVEDDKLELATQLRKRAVRYDTRILLPVDHRFGESWDADPAQIGVSIPDGMSGFDIGPETETLYADALKEAALVVWNGPMGVFEKPAFAHGTKHIAQVMAKLDATTIVGGGDSAAAIRQMGVAEHITHISTGGGASLEFLEGKTLPALDALEEGA